MHTSITITITNTISNSFTITVFSFIWFLLRVHTGLEYTGIQTSECRYLSTTTQ